MNDLIIVCEDSFGLDVKQIVLAINARYNVNNKVPLFKIKGFIVPKAKSDELNKMLDPYLGTIEAWRPGQSEIYAMGIVDPGRKERYAELLKNRGAEFAVLRAPWALAHLDMEFSEGCIIAAHSIMDSAQIGRFATLHNSMIGFDASVGDYSSVMAFSNITTANIKDGVYIGPNSAIMSGVTVHEGARVLPGSVVVRDVKPGQTVSGIPARRVKEPK